MASSVPEHQDNNNNQSKSKSTPNARQIFTVLSDPISVKMLTTSYSGLKADFSNFVGNFTKRQYYTRLRRLIASGLVEREGKHMYRTTSLGSLIYKSHIQSLEMMLDSYWQLCAIDVIKKRSDMPALQRDNIIKVLLNGSQLTEITNDTYLSGFSEIKDFDRLIVEVMRLLDNAEKEVYFASRYHDPHVSNLTFKKFSEGITMHILDGNPGSITLENRINAVIRRPPDQKTYETIQNMIRSPRFELFRLETLPTSFLVVDGKQVLYETVSYANPEEFTIAIANYDDNYLAERYIKYFNLLKLNANTPMIIQTARASG
jgi:predicted transcriptional regulator